MADAVQEVTKLSLTHKWFFATGLWAASPPEDLDRKARKTVKRALSLRKDFGSTVQAFEAKLARDSRPQSLENARQVVALMTIEALLREFAVLDRAKSVGADSDVDEWAKKPPPDGAKACITRIGITGHIGVVPVLVYLADELGVDLGTCCAGYGSGYALVHWAASVEDQIHTIRWLAHRGVSVDARCLADADGCSLGLTPLHLAADRGLVETVATLLALGANPNLGTLPTVQYLTRRVAPSLGTPEDALQRFKGRPPLQFAVSRRHWDTWDYRTIIRLIDIFAASGADLSVEYDAHEATCWLGDAAASKENRINIIDDAIALADANDDPIVLHLRDVWEVAPVHEDASGFFYDYEGS